MDMLLQFKKHRLARPLLPVLCGSLLGACTLAPTYERPTAPIATSYTQTAVALSASNTSTPENLIGWQRFYTEPRLQALISLALANNRDLKIATLNIEQAQAQFRLRRADLAPSLNANASASRTHTPADVSITGTEITVSQYNVNLGITAFELDLFGRVRSASNAAAAQYLASQAAQKTVRIGLIAMVAKTYFNLLAFTEQAAYAKNISGTYNKTTALMQERFDQGVASSLDLQAAQAALAQAKADEARITRALEQTQNALVTLIGTPLPDNLPPASKLSAIHLQTVLPSNLPSLQLTARPDVLEAEFKLQAANANIGAARAAFFPLIALTGTYGTASPELSGLFKKGSLAWSFIPQLTLPIFNFGRNTSNLDLAKVRKNIAIAEYEKAIQIAFQETADALSAYATLGQQLQSTQTQAQAQAEYAKLSGLRLEHGLTSTFDQLDAQRRSDLAEQTTLQLQAAYLANHADLYKVLGGGIND